MPGRKKKQFIDRKKAVSFHLVHRSQRDPLQADEDSSKFVLLQKEKKQEQEKHEEQKSEERAHGVFFEDEYNYLQHLKEVNPECVWSDATPASNRQQPKVHFQHEDLNQASRLGLPAEVFPSEFEENVGLLNKAAPVSGPQVDLDPDVMAALDEDFDFDDPDNELDDEFVVMAQGGEDAGDRLSEEEDDYEDSEEEEDYPSDGLQGSDDEDDDSLGDLKTFRSEETKSHFTNYSMTSSVMRRNEGLTLLDDRFEKFYEQYDDMEIGPLDHDDIDGHREVDADNAIMKQVLDEYIESQQKSSLGDIRNEGKGGADEDRTRDSEEEEEQEDVEMEAGGDLFKLTVTEMKKEERWDCESILSTYSNLYNHPTTIKEPPKGKSIRLSKKTGMPLDVLPAPGPTRKQLEREEHEEYTLPSLAPSRPKDRKETSEEKRSRKQAVKLDRRDRRLEKKANKQAFKDEEKRQGQAMVNLKKNMQGIKIV